MSKVLVLLVIAIVGIVGLTLYLKFSQQKETEAPAVTVPQTTPQVTIAASPVLVPFDYEVVSITSQEILLEGKNGKLHLPNNAKLVSVFRGTPDQNQPTALADLKVGQKVKLEVIPGVSAKVFILQ